ncbi:NADP-dependent succinic semialdehyde dehydrogenase [Sphaerisporangium sp. NPDC051017]|uniref:NADP-dependent succinic semialdehyde dehydrogenase n=1 Tax=Sphaerisporangium sp. NPDC051017 TaxID=3154636 RepID=UPI00344A9EB8
MAIATINPATGETLKTFEPMDDRELDRRLALAAAEFERYRSTGFARRAEWMLSAARLMDEETEQLARLMTTEMGKPLAQARAEAAKCVQGMRFYAEHAEEFLAPEPADAAAVNARRAEVRYRPLGPVLAVMPWNFPCWQVIRFAAPALMAGNVGLLKHASNVPQTALYLGELFARAGFPAGCFQTLLIESGRVEDVLRDARVVAATLTGSEAAGASVASVAGGEVKKTVLELGGSDPYVVMPSADVAAAAGTGVTARVQNNGQSCIAAKRFIVHDQVYDEFTERFVEGMRALRLGDPMDEATDVGPLATQRGRDDVERLVADAAGRGAHVLCGGVTPSRTGWYFEPTVLTGIRPGMRMFEEEVFGPVAQLYRVNDAAEAIALANATRFGLGAGVWTTDPAEQEYFAGELDAGLVFVNGMVRSYPELPFGGVKRSGYGRELSVQGIREFCDVKSVWIG